MIKNLLRNLAQRLLGFDQYLFLFARLGRWRMRLTGYEKEFRFFMQLLPGESVILDIGANIGITTSALAREYPHADVYAFEPMPVNNRVLAKLIAYEQLQNVRLFPIALGDTNGMVDMVMPITGRARMQGLSHVIEPGQQPIKGESVTVPIRRMDDMEELTTLTKISAIKLDVENFEWYVLTGGRELIRKHRPVIYCEMWDNERRTACIDFLGKMGYTVKIHQNGSLIDFTGQPAINFFFLPAESMPE